MGFLFADEFIHTLRLYRAFHLQGIYGSGKTLLSFALAEEFIRRGLVIGCISNIPCKFAPPDWREYLPELGRPRLINNLFLVVDEGGQFFDSRDFSTNDKTPTMYLRKFDVILALPSVVPVDKRLSYLRVQRLARFSIPVIQQIAIVLSYVPIIRWILKPLLFLKEDFWVYNWMIEMGSDAGKGWFILTEPSSYFGMYDNKYCPDNDGDILQLWRLTIYYESLKSPPAGRFWEDEEDDETETEEEEAAAATPIDLNQADFRSTGRKTRGGKSRKV